MSRYIVGSLRKYIKDIGDVDTVSAKLKMFSCKRDEDVESFLREKAIRYEAKNYARTYLIFDEESAEDSGPKIAAFFSIAITSTDYSGISKSKKSKVLGSKPGRETYDAFAGILVAQLARDDAYGSDFINGSEILNECERFIDHGREYLGGRIVYLDCRQPLISVYERSGYKLLSPEPYASGFYKMYKSLPDAVFD
jgi:hypothetical protein